MLIQVTPIDIAKHPDFIQGAIRDEIFIVHDEQILTGYLCPRLTGCGFEYVGEMPVQPEEPKAQR